MSEEAEAGTQGEITRAMEAERQAVERIAAARREADELMARAGENARRIRARGEALVTRMSRLVADRAERDLARLEHAHEAELKALETDELPDAAYRTAATNVAAALIGLDGTSGGK